MSSSMRPAAVTGAAGALAVAAASWRVGALPTTAPAGYLPMPRGAGLALYLAGCGALVVAWVVLGRAVVTATDPDGTAGRVRRLRLLACGWAVPLLAALPVGSRDPWAYLAQAQVGLHGGDPYAAGPGTLPGLVGSQVVAQVSARWRDAPSPYGPLWVGLSEASGATTGSRLVLGVLALRLLVLAGFLLVLWSVPVLARRLGTRPEIATWLVVANPLLLVVVLGGGHNDLLMVGLLCAGLVVATGPGRPGPLLVAAGALVAAAALVKVPAAAALPFLVPLLLRARQGQRPAPATLVRHYLAVAAGAAGAVLVVWLGTGLGTGWVAHVGRSAADPYGWVSFVDPIAYGLQAVLSGPSRFLDPSSPVVRAVDAVAVTITLAVLLLAWRRAHTNRPMWWLALGLTAVLVLAPTLRPWYFCWPLVLAATVTRSRAGIVAAGAVSVLGVFGLAPDGHSLLVTPVEWVALAAVVLTARAARRTLPHRVAPARPAGATG